MDFHRPIFTFFFLPVHDTKQFVLLFAMEREDDVEKMILKLLLTVVSERLNIAYVLFALVNVTF